MITKEELKIEIELEYRKNIWDKLKSKKQKKIKTEDGVKIVDSGLNVWMYHIIILCIYLANERSSSKRIVKRHAIAFSSIIDISSTVFRKKVFDMTKLDLTKNAMIIYKYYHNCDVISLQKAIYHYYEEGVWNDSRL